MFDVGGGRGIARASAMTETGGGPPIAAENTYVLLQLVGNDAAGLYCARTVGKSVTLEEAQEPDNNRVRVHLKARVHDFDEGKVKVGRICHNTIARWIMPAKERPSDAFCNGFVNSNGIETINEIDLGQKTATLVDAKRFRADVGERTARPFRERNVSQTLHSEARSRERSVEQPAILARALVVQNGLSEVLNSQPCFFCG